MLHTILSIIYFVLILGTIVLVHEFGHFFFAKLFGIYVYEFSIGMGPKLFSKKDKKGETSYSIRAIPIGGFVQLAGEGSDEDKDLPKDRLMQSKPAWQRFLVMFFGAGNNFILALIVLFFIGIFNGCPSDEPIIPNILTGSPAEIAGMQIGDYVVSVNGNKVTSLSEVQIYTQVAEGDITYKVKRNNEISEIKVTPLNDEEANNVGYKVGVGFSVPVLTGITKDSKADKAGLKVGDIITKINGNTFISSENLSETIKTSKDALIFDITRNGEAMQINVDISDKKENEDYKIGIEFSLQSGQPTKYGFFDSVKYAFTETGSFVKQILLTFKLLFTGGVGVKDLSGPVGIYTLVSDVSSDTNSLSSTLYSLFYLLALLCVNVGFINLIPFPAFDGGRILFLIIEKIKGSPIKAETENMIHNIGFFILMGLMIYITFNDIVFRLF